MTLVFRGDFGEMGLFRAEFFHMFLNNSYFITKKSLKIYFSSISEKLRSHWSWRKSSNVDHSFSVLLERIRSVVKNASERSRLHLFEAHRHRALGLAATDHISYGSA
jgi:2-oxo-4-hydroxy-4-carboxy--5-ureidoimidazoline (OHCU) decarboxylase